jgi:hypothetical protein
VFIYSLEVPKLEAQRDDGWLVVLAILKNMKVNGKDYPIYHGK